MATWMIRAGRGGVYAKDWVENGYVGIGWDFGGVDIASTSHEQLRGVYEAANPDLSAQKVAFAASQASKFAHTIVAGSTVVTYDPEARVYHIGKITGECIPSPDVDGVTYTRKVDWKRSAPRDRLSMSSRNSLGSLTTIFNISAEVAGELNAAAGKGIGKPEPGIETGDSADDEEARFATYDDGIERIKDRALSLTWEDMEQFVAGLLRTMGYHATVTPKGPDGGRDIVASPDALGLESPRIVVEVKHRKGTIGAPMVRSFLGGLRAGDRGLYVSTGGFSTEARYEADRATVPVRLLDLDGLIRLYVETYDKADAETRSLLPLTRIWWPA
ncbi:MAG: restriction endonuclease [Collinsella sp.]|nr:restriction endonuclease [Collinsella sp.]